MLGFNNPLPIIQAPMAGGITTASLVGAVSEAGGIGSFGFAYSSATEIKKQLQKVRKITKNPINANFFVFPETNKYEDIEFQKAVRSLQDLPINFDRENTPIKPPYNPSLEAQLETIWREKPEVLTFHFGVPDEQIITQAKSLGITVGVTVTNIRNAELAFPGIDLFIAQGSGYRRTPRLLSRYRFFGTKMTSLKLLGLLKQRFSLPIISAGWDSWMAVIFENILNLALQAFRWEPHFYAVTKQEQARLTKICYREKNVLLNLQEPSLADGQVHTKRVYHPYEG